MSVINIFEDVENLLPKINIKMKKVHGSIPSGPPQIGDKRGGENRGIFKEINNGVLQESKRLRLSSEEEKIEVLCLDESPITEFSECIDISDEIVQWNAEDDKDANINPENKGKIAEFPKSLLNVSEYKDDIWRYLRELEVSHPVAKPKYMLKQLSLNWQSRAVLVDWLAGVAEVYKLCNETLHLSVNYIDRFLSHVAVVKGKFQLVGAAAMLLAGKMEDVYPIDIKEWAYLTGDTFTPRQIAKMEQMIVKILRFRMQPPTTSAFVQHLCQEYRLDQKTMHLAMYISELVLLEGQDYLQHLPSKLAAASIALARHTLSQSKPWPRKFKEHCGYSFKQLSPVVQRQQQTLIESPLKEQQEIQTKYKSEKYNKVALLKPKRLVLETFYED
ncbi:G2/mitotic-specific cyclin-A-like [Euwallacea fornicatus]|uniref:G2/mitotic-specific cyclin-A-like n=1 Tax=Euwallacea fornicatus TaxID=995702 RepID=UPI00338DCDF9